ncbi:hypothetical protein N9R81_06220 [Flavobacteriales bacterium]|nr:hypothetical protein [Flavobacteriales bacterium]
MRLLLTIFIIYSSFIGLGQGKNGVPPHQFNDKKAILLTPNKWIEKNPDHVREYLIQSIKNCQHAKISLELDTVIESLSGTHFTFHQT